MGRAVKSPLMMIASFSREAILPPVCWQLWAALMRTHDCTYLDHRGEASRVGSVRVSDPIRLIYANGGASDRYESRLSRN